MHSLVETILKTVCTRYEALPSASANQTIYAIADAREAKMFFDLLVIYGFVAKLYHESSQSKVYVSPPKTAIKSDPELYTEATTYGSCARSIKEHLDLLLKSGNLGGSDYTLSLGKTPAQDKQLTILLVSKNRVSASSEPNQIVQTGTVQTTTSDTAVYRTAEKHEDIFSGPAVMNPVGIRRAKLMKIDENPDTLWKQTKLYVKGNALYSSMILIACIIGLISFISMFMVSKAFLCPDFASMKDENPPWYCTYKTDEKK